MQHATPNRFDAVWIGAVLCIGIAIGFALASLTGGESRARSIGSTAEQHPVGGSRQAERKQIKPENLRVDKLGEVPSEETWEVVVRLNPEERKVAAQKFNSLPRNSQTFASIRAFYKAWTQIDPVAAVTGLSLLSEPEAPTIALEKIGEIASPEAARKIAPLVSQCLKT